MVGNFPLGLAQDLHAQYFHLENKLTVVIPNIYSVSRLYDFTI